MCVTFSKMWTPGQPGSHFVNCSTSKGNLRPWIRLSRRHGSINDLDFYFFSFMKYEKYFEGPLPVTCCSCYCEVAGISTFLERNNKRLLPLGCVCTKERSCYLRSKGSVLESNVGFVSRRRRYIYADERVPLLYNRLREKGLLRDLF